MKRVSMTLLLNAVSRVFTGLVLGIAVLFLGIMLAVGFAFTTNGNVFLPGLLKAWFTTENSLPAINLEPNFLGMLVIIIAVAAVYTFFAFQSNKRLATHHRKINA